MALTRTVLLGKPDVRGQLPAYRLVTGRAVGLLGSVSLQGNSFRSFMQISPLQLSHGHT